MLRERDISDGVLLNKYCCGGHITMLFYTIKYIYY